MRTLTTAPHNEGLERTVTGTLVKRQQGLYNVIPLNWEGKNPNRLDCRERHLKNCSLKCWQCISEQWNLSNFYFSSLFAYALCKWFESLRHFLEGDPEGVLLEEVIRELLLPSRPDAENQEPRQRRP